MKNTKDGIKNQQDKPQNKPLHQFNNILKRKQRKELIITGFIRTFNKKDTPNDIKQIISILYEQRCDSWNKQMSAKYFVINGCSMTAPGGLGATRTGFGNYILKDGNCYEWTLRLIKNSSCFYVGIIMNDKQKIKHASQLGWGLIYRGKGYGYVLNQGMQFCYTSPGGNVNRFADKNPKMIDYGGKCKHKWGSNIGRDGDVITMKVDLTNNNSSISFTINDQDYGIAYDKIFKQCDYRLAVAVGAADNGTQIVL